MCKSSVYVEIQKFEDFWMIAKKIWKYSCSNDVLNVNSIQGNKFSQLNSYHKSLRLVFKSIYWQKYLKNPFCGFPTQHLSYFFQFLGTEYFGENRIRTRKKTLNPNGDRTQDYIYHNGWHFEYLICTTYTKLPIAFTFICNIEFSLSHCKNLSFWCLFIWLYFMIRL